MITKQRWENVRNMTEIPMDVYFEYYKEQGGVLQDYEEFRKIFDKLITQNVTMRGFTGIKVVNFATVVNRLYSYYSKKYETKN